MRSLKTNIIRRKMEDNVDKLNKKQRQRRNKLLKKQKAAEETKQADIEHQKKIENIKSMFRTKMEERKIGRSSKIIKENILEKTLKQLGVDKDKFKADLEAVKKQGGLQVDLKK